MTTRQIIHILALAVSMAGQVAFAGNGSSGVGMVAVDSGISAQIADHATVAAKGSDLIDLSTGEKLLHLDHLDKSALAEYGANMVPSTLGQLSGYEYLPNIKPSVLGDSRKSNFWVVCGQFSCLRLTPLTARNPRVMDIIGGLRGTAQGGASQESK